MSSSHQQFFNLLNSAVKMQQVRDIFFFADRETWLEILCLYFRVIVTLKILFNFSNPQLPLLQNMTNNTLFIKLGILIYVLTIFVNLYGIMKQRYCLNTLKILNTCILFVFFVLFYHIYYFSYNHNNSITAGIFRNNLTTRHSEVNKSIV